MATYWLGGLCAILTSSNIFAKQEVMEITGIIKSEDWND